MIQNWKPTTVGTRSLKDWRPSALIPAPWHCILSLIASLRILVVSRPCVESSTQAVSPLPFATQSLPKQPKRCGGFSKCSFVSSLALIRWLRLRVRQCLRRFHNPPGCQGAPVMRQNPNSLSAPSACIRSSSVEARHPELAGRRRCASGLRGSEKDMSLEMRTRDKILSVHRILQGPAEAVPEDCI